MKKLLISIIRFFKRRVPFERFEGLNVRLGRELDLFSINGFVGGGLVLWHPKGALLRNIIETEWKQFHLDNGYNLLCTPHIASEELFTISGHLQTYSENMYAPMEIEGKPYRVKPMNCPMHLMIYKTKLHSYRELPIRYAEFGTVYRYKKFDIHSLMDLNSFTQDDGHIIVQPELLEKEILTIFKMVINCLNMFGFKEYKIYLSTRPDKYLGNIEQWNNAENLLENILKKTGRNYEIDIGGGGFYGPKIDIKIKDFIGRLWQCSTIQFDFNLSERFDIYYIDKEGKKVRPYIIHRALMGSVERFVGVLLEHYAGALPIWLSPIQVTVLNMNVDQEQYCEDIIKILKEAKIRVSFDNRNKKISCKIKENIKQKIPYLLIVSKQGIETKSITVITRSKKNLGMMSLDKFIENIKHEVINKR